MCTEWSFGGIAAGSKYRSDTNTVDVYPEFEDEKVNKRVEKLNHELSLVRYIFVLQNNGYKPKGYGYFKFTPSTTEGVVIKNWVTLFRDNILQVWAYAVDEGEDDDRDVFEKEYDTGNIQVTPEELETLIHLLIDKQIR